MLLDFNLRMNQAKSGITLFWAFCGGLAALVVLPQTALRAQSAPPLPADDYQGSVPPVNASNQPLVSPTVYGQRQVTVATTPRTRYWTLANIGLEGLKQGDNVVVAGLVDSTQGTVAARRIVVHPFDRANSLNRPRAVGGTISSTAPKLTLTTADGKSYTILPVRNRIPVLTPASASFDDIQVGRQVNVHGHASAGDTLTARRVDIVPQHRARQAQ